MSLESFQLKKLRKHDNLKVLFKSTERQERPTRYLTQVATPKLRNAVHSSITSNRKSDASSQLCTSSGDIVAAASMNHFVARSVSGQHLYQVVRDRVRPFPCSKVPTVLVFAFVDDRSCLVSAPLSSSLQLHFTCSPSVRPQVFGCTRNSFGK